MGVKYLTRKIKRLREQIKKAQKGITRVEAWEFWQKKLATAKTYPPVKCSNCNMFLEDKDYIMKDPTDPLSDVLCGFCGFNLNQEVK